MAMSSRTPPTLDSRSPAPSSSHARPQVPTNVTPEGVLGEILLDKSYLNEYCQKLRLPLPIYQTEVENGAYPRFRSTVRVCNGTFTSANKFLNRASAEQDVAKLALKHLLAEDKATSTEDKAKSTNLYLRELVCLAKGQWKTMMNEFILKMKIQCAYETVQVQCLPPLFVSSLTLNGTCYKAETGTNKKEAEQLAARAAILSLLDDPTFATPISQVIKAKVKVDAAFREAKDIPSTRVTGNELKITGNAAFNSGANANAMPLNPIFMWSSINPMPITPALNLADVPSSSRKRQLEMNEKKANKKWYAYSHAKKQVSGSRK